MNERRIDPRKIINTRIRLYHPVYGRIDGQTQDISDGGVAVELLDQPKGLMDAIEEILYFRPINVDVLFPVTLLRKIKNGVVLKFIE